MTAPGLAVADDPTSFGPTLLLSRADVERHLDPSDALAIVPEVLRAMAHGRVVMPAKVTMDLGSFAKMMNGFASALGGDAPKELGDPAKWKLEMRLDGTTAYMRMPFMASQLPSGKEWVGIDLARDPAAIRARIGVVFQSPAVDKKLTVRENLRFGGLLLGLAGATLAARIEAALAATGLADRQRDRTGELSGGLRRRVEIAKCLLGQPEVMLLDEASTGLDALASSCERRPSVAAAGAGWA